MPVTTRTVAYQHGDMSLEGYLATPARDDNTQADKARPAVIICHAWAGRSAFENSYAEKLAALGFTGFAADLYGTGVLGTSKEENQKLIEPFMQDRQFLRSRLVSVIETASAQEEIDATRLIVMGFCFGGLCALDVARAGADVIGKGVKGVASFHGLLDAPGAKADTITAKVIAFHGYDDPMAEPDAMRGFCDEMTRAGADWQLHALGGVMHAFTNPQANDPNFGTVFDETARDRAWGHFRAFADECLGD